jgi:hypothetical protein
MIHLRKDSKDMLAKREGCADVPVQSGYVIYYHATQAPSKSDDNSGA